MRTSLFALLIALVLGSMAHAQEIRPRTAAGDKALLFSVNGFGAFGVGGSYAGSQPVTTLGLDTLFNMRLTSPIFGFGMRWYLGQNVALRASVGGASGTSYTPRAGDTTGATDDVTDIYLGISPALEFHIVNTGRLTVYAGGMLNYSTNLHATGTWADPARRRLDVSASTTAGSGLTVHLAPDAGGGLISARITNVADVADSVLGVGGFAGGSATVQGRLRPEGADFEVEMRNVRLVRAPVLAQILTMGSLRGMADTLNGEGVSFTRVTAPMKLRGSRLTIGDARAVGGSLGLTGKGVVDIDRRTMDLSGAIAPAQGINSMLGSVPLVGQLLVSKKGEGLFGVTYSAKGPFAEPKVSVNPFSLAAPGILRRMFEPRPSAARDEPPRPLAAALSPQP